MENFVLDPHNSPTEIIANESSTGFKLITVASTGNRYYRITLENTATQELKKYDFTLDLSDLENGAPVEQDIPYIPRKFVPWDKEVIPEPLDPTPSDPPEVFRGEIFKPFYLSNPDDTFHAEVPLSINLDTTYRISGSNKLIRFVYYRMISGIPRFVGQFGNIAFLGQYEDGLTIGVVGQSTATLKIDPNDTLSVISVGDIDYYIVKLSATPNIIIGNGSPLNRVFTDEYFGPNGDPYVYVIRSAGHCIKGAGFKIVFSYGDPMGESYSLVGRDVYIVPAGLVEIKSITPVFYVTSIDNILEMIDLSPGNTVDFRIFVR